MEVKPGYKQTVVGVIPEDWEVKTLGDLCSFTQGVQIPQSEQIKTPRDGYIRYLYIRDFFSDDFQWYIEDQYPSKVMDSSDIMMVNTGNTAGVVYSGATGVLSNNAFRIRHDENKLWRDYLFTFLTSSNTQLTIRSFFNSAGQPHVGHKNIAQVPIALPPLPEQRAIATALSDVDALIASLDRLIAKKRDMKQASMQELLTGKRRLPGFSGEWEVKTLGSITSLVTNGFVGTVTNFYTEADDGVLYIQGYNVEVNGYNLNGIKRVAKAFHDQHQKSCLQEGDLLTIQTGDIGVTTLVPKEFVGANCHALVISRFDKRNSCPSYYCQYFNSERGRVVFKEIETGSTMKHLNVGDMVKLPLPAPPLPEQTAIATILSDMDTEIAALEQKRDKTRLLKQGMMLELLTGRIRLV